VHGGDSGGEAARSGALSLLIIVAALRRFSAQLSRIGRRGGLRSAVEGARVVFADRLASARKSVHGVTSIEAGTSNPLSVAATARAKSSAACAPVPALSGFAIGHRGTSALGHTTKPLARTAAAESVAADS